METFFTLFTIDIPIIYGLTFRTHLLNIYEDRYMFKNPITLLKVLCAFRIEENVQKLVRQLARLQWSHVAKMA